MSSTDHNDDVADGQRQTTPTPTSTTSELGEVSLPGASTNVLEEATILEVLNNKTPSSPIPTPSSDSAANNASQTADATQATKAEQLESKAAVGAEQKHDQKHEHTAQQANTVNRPACDGNVLDIESHLIETCSDYYKPKDNGIGINELPPVKDELSVGASKIETETNVRTVIEVEPAGIERQQIVELLVPPINPQAAAATAQHEQEHDHEHEPDSDSTSTTQGSVDTAIASCDVDTDAVQHIAAELIKQIEVEAIEAVAQQQQQLTDSVTTRKTEKHSTESSNEVDVVKAEGDQSTEAATENTLSQRVDAQLSEVTSILKASATSKSKHTDDKNNELKLVDVPAPCTPLDEEERKAFIDSLPQIDINADSNHLATECRREYYQSLKKYLIQQHSERPPIPLQTYRWEDLRRAKERGGYPWTHLYKRPLGPNEDPEILLLLRKSQELRFTSESPRSLKKVRIHDEVIVTETERYIQELSDADDDEHQLSAGEAEYETNSLHSESISCVSDSVLATGNGKPRKSTRLDRIRGYLRRRRNGRLREDAQSLPGTSTNTSRRSSDHKTREANANAKEEANGKAPNPDTLANNPDYGRCYPIMKKLKSMADRQKQRIQIKRINLRKSEKIVLDDKQKILRLKSSPKAERGEIPHFIEKQDSDDVLEIVELDESPSRKRRDNHEDEDAHVVDDATPSTSHVQPDEIIEIDVKVSTEEVEADNQLEAHDSAETEKEQEATGEEVPPKNVTGEEAPPKKAPRLRREHVYEEIDQNDASGLADIMETGAVDALKESLTKQDNSVRQTLAKRPLPWDRMGSSEEETVCDATDTAKPSTSLHAPLSSIDSTSSEEDRNKVTLTPVVEESDAASGEESQPSQSTTMELKPTLKKESSPAPSDKKVVTFSHVEDEAEPHREDIELPDDVLEATRKLKTTNDHEYEPIGVPPVDKVEFTESDGFTESQIVSKPKSSLQEAEDLQRNLEDRFFTPETTTVTSHVEARSNYEIPEIQVEVPNQEDLPLKAENGKKSFIASAQDRTRKMQAGLKTQAGKIKTKLRSPVKKAPSGSPKERERKRFKAPEFSKIKMPEIKRPDMSRFKDIKRPDMSKLKDFKRPDMSKLKDFKRPEFTKFNKPDLTKFKLPEKLTTLKLRRSKSMKENENDEEVNSSVDVGPVSAGAQTQPKKIFDFNFGTYPRAFSRKKKTLEPQSSLGTEEPSSIIPSTLTQPSVESSNSPQGDRGPGPVRSRWADKFSDVSYNDSEGSRYRRYGSEQASSFDRESSLERQMKDDMEETEETGSEAPDLGILRGVGDTKQFAEFDEENRAIHEISNLRAGEFKRRPLVHQDSDLRSEDSKEAEGWTEREIEKNKLLLKAEMEAEASYQQRHGASDDSAFTQDAHSLASSGKKVVMEEIDEDEFFLRKRGISEDNIELRQYISEAIREGYDIPINSLKGVGSDPIEFAHEYDVPPPKPKRLNRDIHYQKQNISQDSNRSDIGDELSMSQNSDYFADTPAPPKAPTRKGRRSRSKQSVESQEINDNFARVPYFEDDEEYLRPPKTNFKQIPDELNNLDAAGKRAYSAEPEDDEIDSIMSDQKYKHEQEDLNDGTPFPEPPRRRKRQTRELSMEKDAYINGFGGRSVSNTYLQRPEDVIVYHTKHEYQEEPPLAAQERYEDDGHSFVSQKSRSRSPTRYPRHQIDSLSLDKSPSQSKMHQYETDSAHEKFIVDMVESDGYAVVRKDQPKPTPPARRKKFSRSPGERFATLPGSMPTPPPERPPPPRGYMPSPSSIASRDSTQPVPPRRKSALSIEDTSSSRIAYNEEDDYEEPEILDERTESPRNLQSGEVINRMKGRPLPPPPRPPRDKRQRSTSRRSDIDEFEQQVDSDDLAYKQEEVEISTQTDPLPDDFVCEAFEITDDMKVIESRYKPSTKTLEELLSGESATTAAVTTPEDEQLARGLQRFRDANQRSQSEKSRASSSLENRSKSHSRPQTPSAIIIERRVSTPVPSNQRNESVLEASLTVQPLDDLELEEEALRREGLLSDSSQYSKEDLELEEDTNISKITASSTEYAPHTMVGQESVGSPIESELEETEREDDEVERTMQRGYGTTSEAEEQSEDVERYSTNEDEEELEYKRILAELEAQDREEQELEQQRENERLQNEESYERTIESRNEPDDNLQFDYDLSATTTDLYDKELEEPEINKLKSKTIELFSQPDVVLAEEPQQTPLPPPRRKSTTSTELPSIDTIDTTISSLATISEQTALTEKPFVSQQVEPEASGHMSDLEVDRLREHALQAGQILVSQLHGTQISTDDFECKSGNIVVKNIELPPNFIEDIVERVRSSEREHHHTIETQTSRQASSEEILEERDTTAPPPKPPRHKDFETVPPQIVQSSSITEAHTTVELPTTDVITTSNTTTTTTAAFPPVFASTEYLQTIYSQLQQRASVEADDAHKCHHHHRRHHHHHHHYRRCSCSESSDVDDAISQHEHSDEENETVQSTQPTQVCRNRSRTRTRTRSRTRSRTHPPADAQPSVMQAGSQFISACSLSLVKIINHLTVSVRGGSGEADAANENHQIPTLVMFFIAITFGLLIYLLSGKSVHTHHWDFFNPPGNAGRQS